MIYRVIEDFTDLENGHRYKKGDLYPCADYIPTNERIKMLGSVNNRQKKQLIEELQPVRSKRTKRNEVKKGNAGNSATKRRNNRKSL